MLIPSYITPTTMSDAFKEAVQYDAKCVLDTDGGVGVCCRGLSHFSLTHLFPPHTLLTPPPFPSSRVNTHQCPNEGCMYGTDDKCNMTRHKKICKHGH